MDQSDRLAERFEEHRTRLTTVANRMLGSRAEADDAVQETWLRLSRSDADAIENLGAWLTTVLSRICLNVLQARRSRPEVPLDAGGRLRHAKLVEAFLAAARHGEFDGLLALLDPDVVLRADPAVARMGAAGEIRGGTKVAEFSRYARGATPALLDGAAAAVWMVGGRPRVVYRFTTDSERITAVELIGDAERLRELDLVVLGE